MKFLIDFEEIGFLFVVIGILGIPNMFYLHTQNTKSPQMSRNGFKGFLKQHIGRDGNIRIYRQAFCRRTLSYV